LDSIVNLLLDEYSGKANSKLLLTNLTLYFISLYIIIYTKSDSIYINLKGRIDIILNMG